MQETNAIHDEDDDERRPLLPRLNTDDSLNVSTDPFIPFPERPDDELDKRPSFTFRALLIGCTLGSLVNISNLYIGLRTGYLLGVSVLGAIIGFYIIQAVAHSNSRFFGGGLGRHELNIIQTAATASGGVSTIFYSSIPAIYQMGLTNGTTPKEDYLKMVMLVGTITALGLLLAIALRNLFIVRLARSMRLVFPSSTAAAVLLRSLNKRSLSEHKDASDLKIFVKFFGGAILFRVLNQFAPGLLFDWNYGWWIYTASASLSFSLPRHVGAFLISWGFGTFEWTTAFIGGGMLIGPNTAISFIIGSILGWGILGPITVVKGWTAGKQSSVYPDIWNNIGMEQNGMEGLPSPRYWLLWPGVALTVACSFTEIATNYKILFDLFKQGLKGFKTAWNRARTSIRGADNADGVLRNEDDEYDNAAAAHKPKQKTQFVQLVSLCLITAFMWLLLALYIHLPAIVFPAPLIIAFFFTATLIHLVGTTDIGPLGTIGKLSQIAIGYLILNSSLPLKEKQFINMVTGSLAVGAAAQALDLMCDFRTGFLLGTPPNILTYAQAIGCIVAAWIAPAILTLFATAYPCILDNSDGQCFFPTPAAGPWVAVTLAVTSGASSVPKSAAICSLIAAIIGSVITLIHKYMKTHPRFSKIEPWMPNMTVVGMGFIIPGVQVGVAFTVGAFISHVWQKRNARTHKAYVAVVAAGLLSGEGVAGVITAIMQVMGWDRFRTTLGCIGGKC